MTNPSTDFESIVRVAFAKIEPDRSFLGCKIAIEGDSVFVRIYSASESQKPLMPPPYQLFIFDSVSGLLTRANDEDSKRFEILNYK